VEYPDPMQDYKSLHVVVVMCTTEVTTQTQQTYGQRQPARWLLTTYTIISAKLKTNIVQSWTKITQCLLFKPFIHWNDGRQQTDRV